MINKKAQGLSTSTIILLVLGIIILVVLVLGFRSGWKPLSELMGGKNNLDTIATSCNSACTTSSKYNYCSVMKEVKDGKNPKFEATCNDLATNPVYTSRNYGIPTCPSLCTD